MRSAAAWGSPHFNGSLHPAQLPSMYYKIHFNIARYSNSKQYPQKHMQEINTLILAKTAAISHSIHAIIMEFFYTTTVS